MNKTTVYLPVELKTALTRAAQRRGISEAHLIREALEQAIGADKPAPRGGLYESRTPIARDADLHLRGFGDR